VTGPSVIQPEAVSLFAAEPRYQVSQVKPLFSAGMVKSYGKPNRDCRKPRPFLSPGSDIGVDEPMPWHLHWTLKKQNGCSRALRGKTGYLVQ
jgi:hypothetical protein